MKTVDIGRIGEKAACKFLRKNGYKIVERNVHMSHNEIDIIAKNKQTLVFVEVKARSVDADGMLRFGSPAGAVTRSKQERTVQAARAYLTKAPTSRQIRFDVIEVFLSKETNKPININHILNAFGA